MPGGPLPTPCQPGPAVPKPPMQSASLTTSIIKSRLAAASPNQRDTVACEMIFNAANAELASLDLEGVLRLYAALTAGITSMTDLAALGRLAQHMKFQPKPLEATFYRAKGALLPDAKVESLLKVDLVKRIYAAERKRYTIGEDYYPWALTFGRGQLGQPAYEDVIKHCKTELQEVLAYARLRRLLERPIPARPSWVDWVLYKMVIPVNYADVYTDHMVEDFVVSAFLGLKIKSSGAKPGRNDVQTLRFAVAVYHGMYGMVAWAQEKVNTVNDWDLVEGYLRSCCTHPKEKGQPPRPLHTHGDECDYIHEVVP